MARAGQGPYQSIWYNKGQGMKGTLRTRRSAQSVVLSPIAGGKKKTAKQIGKFAIAGELSTKMPKIVS